MKKIKRWRYYCDYCKKSGGSGFHMKNHEAVCTNNPDRVCGLCRMAGYVQPETKELIDLMNKFFKTDYNEHWDDEWNVWKEGITEEDVMKELKKVTDCPACILSAMRLTKTTGLFSKETFNFHSERKAFFDTYKNQDEYYY